jgi:hypothetical protein
MKKSCCCSCHDKIGPPRQKTWREIREQAKKEAREVLENLSGEQKDCLQKALDDFIKDSEGK